MYWSVQIWCCGLCIIFFCNESCVSLLPLSAKSISLTDASFFGCSLVGIISSSSAEVRYHFPSVRPLWESQDEGVARESILGTSLHLGSYLYRKTLKWRGLRATFTKCISSRWSWVLCFSRKVSSFTVETFAVSQFLRIFSLLLDHPMILNASSSGGWNVEEKFCFLWGVAITETFNCDYIRKEVFRRFLRIMELLKQFLTWHFVLQSHLCSARCAWIQKTALWWRAPLHNRSVVPCQSFHTQVHGASCWEISFYFLLLNSYSFDVFLFSMSRLFEAYCSMLCVVLY